LKGLVPSGPYTINLDLQTNKSLCLFGIKRRFLKVILSKKAFEKMFSKEVIMSDLSVGVGQSSNKDSFEAGKEAASEALSSIDCLRSDAL
jgi:hypothetical protein